MILDLCNVYDAYLSM